LNPFAFVAGNSISNFDPFGLDYIEYTGRLLNYYGGQRGVGRKQKPLLSCPATSGTLQKVSAAGGKLGPIKGGHYRIDLTLDPNRIAGFDGSSLTSGEGIQRIPAGNPSEPHGDMHYLWGGWRMRLDKVDVDSDRDNFYIHNSHKGQTSGCIETCDELLEQVLNYAKRNGSIEVFVDYTGPYTRGDTSRTYRPW